VIHRKIVLKLRWPVWWPIRSLSRIETELPGVHYCKTIAVYCQLLLLL